MTLGNRIKEIRKHFKLSQTAFGAKLCVSRDVINNAENDRVVPKEIFLQHICSVFDIDENWLYNGEGEMFAETSDDFVQRIKNEYDLDDLDVMITKRYLELSKEERQSFRNTLLKLVNGQVDISQLPEPKMTVEQAEEEYMTVCQVNCDNSFEKTS